MSALQGRMATVRSTQERSPSFEVRVGGRILRVFAVLSDAEAWRDAYNEKRGLR